MPVQINERTLSEAVWGPDSYGLLFVILIGDYLLLSLVDSTRWGTLVRALPIALTVLFAFHTSCASRLMLRFAQFASVACVVGGIVNAIADTERTNGIGFLLITVLLVLTPVVILRRVLPREDVDVETIFAAVDVYILIGIIFACLYVGMARVLPQPFFAQKGPHPANDFVYFSFITLTTVGYGDLTPMAKAARSVVVLEALIGQIFLVVLVARLVSAYSAQLRGRPRFLSRTPSEQPGRLTGALQRHRGGTSANAVTDDTGDAGAGEEVGDEPDDPWGGHTDDPAAGRDRWPDG